MVCGNAGVWKAGWLALGTARLLLLLLLLSAPYKETPSVGPSQLRFQHGRHLALRGVKSRSQDPPHILPDNGNEGGKQLGFVLG